MSVAPFTGTVAVFGGLFLFALTLAHLGPVMAFCLLGVSVIAAFLYSKPSQDCAELRSKKE